MGAERSPPSPPPSPPSDTALVAVPELDEDAPPLSLEEILALLRSADADDRLDGLLELAGMVDGAFGDDGAALGQAVREADGIRVLSWNAMDTDVEIQQQALLVLGNLCSDGVDPFSALTKAELLRAGAAKALALAVASDDAAIRLAQ